MSSRQGVDWFIMRLVMSRDIPDGLTVLKYRTPFGDIVESHLMLDALETMREAMREEQKRKQRLQSRR